MDGSTEFELMDSHNTNVDPVGTIAGFTTFQMTAPAEEGKEQLTVIANDAGDARLPLTVVTTGSDVIELESAAASDFGTAQLSGTYESGEEFNITVLTK